MVRHTYSTQSVDVVHHQKRFAPKAIDEIDRLKILSSFHVQEKKLISLLRKSTFAYNPKQAKRWRIHVMQLRYYSYFIQTTRDTAAVVLSLKHGGILVSLQIEADIFINVLILSMV